MAKKPTKKNDQNFYEFLQATAGDLSSGWRQNERLAEISPNIKQQFSKFSAVIGRLAIIISTKVKPALFTLTTQTFYIASETTPLIGAAARDIVHGIRIVASQLTSKTARKLYQIIIAASIATGATAAVMVASATYAIYSGDLSSPSTLITKKDTGTTLLDRNGKVLYRVYGANNRKLVEFSQIPQSLIKATLAAEDPHFYEHSAFSFKGTARAIYQDIINRSKVQGGSTITQQLVKNALLSPGKSFTRKYQELILATELEQRYSKNDILQMYFNEIYYGQGSYGIESAAQTYFHKSAKDLDLSESALLAGLPLCPGTCDPNVDLGAATRRRNYVLDRMAELKTISPEEAKAAKSLPIQASARQVEIHAPHFVFYVLDQLRQQYGDDLVERGGITVYTSLDLAKQEIAEKIAKEQVAKLSRNNVSNAALVSMDPATGEVLAMVGSIDYNNPVFGNVNVTLAKRQPGSSFKPFAYLTALKKGWNGSSVVDDLPIALPSGDGTIWRPLNYDKKFRGKNITLRRALTNSLNIPAVHVLQYAGVHDTIKTAQDLGITTLTDESRYGLALVLGGGEVKMLDMATAYSTLANNGTRSDPKPIIKVLDRHNNDLTKPRAASRIVIDPRLVYMLTHIMSDNNSRAEIFGTNSPLHLSRPSAAKTGTTEYFNDNWTAGYTPDVVTIVWVGNNDNSPMRGVDGITGAAPIWKNYMEAVHQGLPVRNFNKPAGVLLARVCRSDGGLANPWDQSIEEVFLVEKPQTRRCTSAPPPPKPAEPSPEDAAKALQEATEAALREARRLQSPENQDPDSDPDTSQPKPIKPPSFF